MSTFLSFFKYCGSKVSSIFAPKLHQALKQLSVIFILSMVSVGASAQHGRSPQFDEIGLMGGCCYYNGEICPVKPFYNPQIAFGAMIRHGFSPRFALAFEALRLKFIGADADFDNPYQNARNAKFENEVIELALQMEFNFLPLIKGSKNKYATPFIAAGPGLAIGSFPHEGLQLCIPFGVGVKISPTERFTATIEWKYRKLFTDMLDHIDDDLYDPQYGVEYTKQRSFLGNTDMYAFLGVSLAFQISSTKGSKSCSAYR